MKDVPDDLVEEFIQACRNAAGRGLMRCSSGNLSRRLDGARFLATATRSWMEHLTPEEVVLCRLSDGSVLDGPTPTVELGFHAEILRTRPDVNVVLHYQTPCATALACQEPGPASYFVIPEIPFYMGHVAQIPYLLPGSEELAEAVADAMQDHDMAVMRNHGLVTVAADYAHAIQNAEFFELACYVITHGGTAVRPLAESDVERLLELRRDAARGTEETGS